MRLTEAQKEEIVILFARFRRPVEVKEHLFKEHGVVVDLGHLFAYHPEKPQFRTAEKWRTIFIAARKAYLEEVAAVPIANKGYRLNLLHEAALEARSRGNYVLMADLLEQAAKEVGDVLTNRQKHEVDLRDERALAELTDDERLAAVARIFDKALGRDGPKKEKLN